MAKVRCSNLVDIILPDGNTIWRKPYYYTTVLCNLYVVVNGVEFTLDKFNENDDLPPYTYILGNTAMDDKLPTKVNEPKPYCKYVHNVVHVNYGETYPHLLNWKTCPTYAILNNEFFDKVR